jgi:hypothetical protein
MAKGEDGPKKGSQNFTKPRGSFPGRAYPVPATRYEGEHPDFNMFPGRREKSAQRRKRK